MKHITKLSKLETHGVALVTRGANRRKIAMAKTEEGLMQLEELFIEIIKGAGDYDPAAMEKICQENGLDAQGTETFKAIVKLASAFKGNENMRNALVNSLPKALGFVAAEPLEEKTPVESDESSSTEDEHKEPEDMPATTEPKPAEGVQKSDATPKADPASDIAKLDAVLKSQEAVIKSLQTRAEAAEAAVKQLADENRTAAWISKAEKELAFVPGKTAQELGTLLKTLEDVSKETAEGQFKMLKSVSDAMQKSALFKSVGTDTHEENDALGKIQAIVAKSEAKTDIERARATVAVLESNDDLYKQFKEEQRLKAKR